MKKHIPNILTLLNLLAGIIAIILAVEGDLIGAGIFIMLGILFDFFDGFVARILKVQGELGKQLDSLADMVTSGVAPGVILFQLLGRSGDKWLEVKSILSDTVLFSEVKFEAITIVGLLFSLAAAYRLANFNIDERQTSSFIGLPTPAATLCVISIPFIIEYTNPSMAVDMIQNKWFLIVLTLVLSYLMNANVPLFSLKFKDYTIKNNKIKYIFIVLAVLLLVTIQFVALPIIIIMYVLLSVIENSKKLNLK